METTKKNNQWPKAFAAVFMIACISGTAYLLKEPSVMWAIILVIWIMDRFE